MKQNKNTKRKLALYMIILFVIVTASAVNGKAPMGLYPKGYIPFWSQQRGGHETALINTQHIVRIVPIYKENDKGRKEVVYLECYLADGVKITIEENFEEFYNRVRSSQSR